MSVAKNTAKHFVDLCQKVTTLRRLRVVVEAPSNWDAKSLSRLDGRRLADYAEEAGRSFESEAAEVDITVEGLSEIDVSGPVPDGVPPDIVFGQTKVGDLFERKTGEDAKFRK